MVKKYKVFLLFITLLLILTLQIADASKLPLQGVIITVDPGHGGIWLTQSNKRMATNLINIRKMRCFYGEVSFLMVQYNC